MGNTAVYMKLKLQELKLKAKCLVFSTVSFLGRNVLSSPLIKWAICLPMHITR